MTTEELIELDREWREHGMLPAKRALETRMVLLAPTLLALARAVGVSIENRYGDDLPITIVAEYNTYRAALAQMEEP